MQGLQGDLPTFFVVVIATAAFLAGLCCERLRAILARQAWQKRRWRRGEGGVPFPVTDPAEQLRLVMDAKFEKRRLLSRPMAFKEIAPPAKVVEPLASYAATPRVGSGHATAAPPRGRQGELIRSNRRHPML